MAPLRSENKEEQPAFSIHTSGARRTLKAFASQGGEGGRRLALVLLRRGDKEAQKWVTERALRALAGGASS